MILDIICSKTFWIDCVCILVVIRLIRYWKNKKGDK